MPPAALCDVCLDCLCRHRGIQLQQEQPDTLLFNHHFTIQTLEASANETCPICSPLWSQLQPLQSTIPYKPSSDSPLTFLMLQGPNSLRIEGSRELAAMITNEATTVDGIERASVVIFLLQPPKDIESCHARKPTSGSTGSSESWSLVSQWLHDCRSHHTDCQAPDEPVRYPTRLLQFGADENDPVRLIETADGQPTGGYVTLSHCWANSISVKLKKTSFEHFKSGLSIKELPLTFQHAIEVARRLDKRYIWIDSMCIFQDGDDKSDWLREAALMDKVYSNGYLNIAATGASDSSRGLFAKRDPQNELSPIRLTCPTTALADGQPGPPENLVLTDILFLERELMKAPLNLRAWVLQERLLAPRVLHFGSRQLFWECKAGVLCERYPETLPDCTRSLTSTTFKNLDITKDRRMREKTESLLSNQQHDSPRLILRTWDNVVRAYSNTQLTFNGDKAIALSGIAKVLREVFEDEYVAGMWRSCLEAQLLWSVSDTCQVDFKPSTRTFGYRAPTWSWLSVDGEIMPGRYLRKSLCIKVISVTLKYETDDTTGLIKSGSLELRGRLRPLKIRKLLITTAEGQEQVVPGLWTLNVGGKDLSESKGQPWERISIVNHFDVPHANFDESNRVGELFLMSAGGPWPMQDDPFHDYNEDPFHSMLLLRCVNKEQGVFHRFGVAVLNTVKKPDAWAMVQELDEVEAQMPCVEYDAAKHLHTIIIE